MVEVDIKDNGPLRIITVSGEVDLSSAPTLWNHVQQAFHNTQSLRVRLQEVSYIDSAGIAVLVQSYRHAKQTKVDFALLDPSPEVSAVIELARLNELFTIETSA